MTIFNQETFTNHGWVWTMEFFQNLEYCVTIIIRMTNVLIYLKLKVEKCQFPSCLW